MNSDFDYIDRIFTITAVVSDYETGDTFQLYTNNGWSDAIDWDTAYNNNLVPFTSTTLVTTILITEPGNWQISGATYDSLGNTLGSDAAVSDTMYIDLVPKAPKNILTYDSYDSTTHVLTLDRN